MDTTDSDERVMEHLARGDDDALAELVGRWQGPLWCFIDRMCRRADVTDDVYQEVWTRIFVYRKRYDPARPFRAYLFAIAVNCCRRVLKRRRWRDEIFGRLDDAPPPVAADPSPAERMAAGERHRMLHRAISRLPEMQRAVVLLYLLGGGDYGGVAEALGKRPATVRSHMHHALTALRRTLTTISIAAEGKVDHERQVH